MKKTTQVALLLAGLSSLSLPEQASAEGLSLKAKVDSVGLTQVDNKSVKTYSPKYWYVGAEFFSPIIFDDLYSWTKEKFHFGTGLQLSVGRQFSPVFGLELSLGIGRNKMQPSAFQHNYVLGRHDAYTYYPYTLIDGTNYTQFYPGLVGEWGNNPAPVQISGVPFRQIYSRTTFAQLGLKAAFNLNRLFSPKGYREQAIELWLKPGVWASRFHSHVYQYGGNERIAPHVNKDITLGLGGDLAVRLNLSPRWAVDLTNRFIWEREHAMDGILNAKRAYDSYMWQPALGLVYKLRKAIEVNPTNPVAPQPADPAQLLNLNYWYPTEVEMPKIKERTHAASLYLTYVLDQTYLAPELHNNPQELERINKELKVFTDNPDYTVRSIKVEGFASPEGPYDNNMRLAVGRANTIINYVVSRSGLDRNLFTLGRLMENWDGLRDTLQNNPNLPGRDKFLKMLNEMPDTEQLKVALTKQKEYAYLLENVYPHLRKSTWTIDYVIKNYNALEAKEVIRTNPTALSPEEMYAVAVAYGLGSPEADATIETLYQHYPSSDIAHTYKGIQHLQGGRYQEAIQTLTNIARPKAEALNALAVAYAYTGDIARAKELLRSVATTSTDARRNLNLLIRLTQR